MFPFFFYLAEGKPIPTELRNEEAALRQEIDLEDEHTAGWFFCAAVFWSSFCLTCLWFLRTFVFFFLGLCLVAGIISTRVHYKKLCELLDLLYYLFFFWRRINLSQPFLLQDRHSNLLVPADCISQVPFLFYLFVSLSLKHENTPWSMVFKLCEL